jgi:cytochrome c553
LSNEEIWLHHLEECRNYIDINKKRPSSKSKDEEIKQLGAWLSTQKKNYDKKIGIMQDAEIYDKWTAFINDIKYSFYFLSNEEKWRYKLQECRNYIDINKKRPSMTSNDNEIKQLGKWLSHQKTNYDKKIGIMQDEAIYDKWTAFTTDPAYAKYFLIKITL